jgi:hypothetical protein
MTSHKKSGSCCRRHNRIVTSRSVAASKAIPQKVLNQKLGIKAKKETNVMIMQYRQKPNGVWATKGPRTLNNALSVNLTVNAVNVSDLSQMQSGVIQ